MIKNVIGGIAVGIANVIPGVSGGTMMVILGIFNRTMEAISGVFKKHNDQRKEDIIFLAQVLIGAAVGLVGFAKVLEFLFNTYPTQTIYWFIGLVVFSIPLFMKGEMKGSKIHVVALIAGMACVLALEFFSPDQGIVDVNPTFPDLTIGLFVTMVIVGIIGGGTMLMPGISGSLVLLIIGKYYLFKSYLAHVTSFQLNILIPLVFVAIGMAIGIVLSAKICDYFIKTNKRAFLSFILGLICASSVVLIPFDAVYTLPLVISSIICFCCGGLIVVGLGMMKK